MKTRWEEYIVTDPAVLAGKPVVKGTRLAVEFMVGLMADEWTMEEMIRNYPGLTREQILACLAYAQENLSRERLYPVPA